MYTNFFSLKVKPFSISPDPDFLYLSERHKEAFAHLRHGLQNHTGFALLTGEVGTGKTTISRSILEEMGEDTDIAFILNPALSEMELLATICDNFDISYQKNNLPSLFNELSNWVIANHSNNRRAIVLIDEAQHLSFEALEQLRLLTNIEINTKKPLQVILIGQTELQEKLKQPQFRQLSLCITSRYHLLSLKQKESNTYIQHRLAIAGSSHAIFDKSAMKEIFATCNGTPRLTNILCDRSLLAAYAQNSHIVTAEIVRKARKELHFTHQVVKEGFLKSHWRLAALIFLSVLTLLQAPQIPKIFYSNDLFSIESIEQSETETKQSIVESVAERKQPITASEQFNDNWFDLYPQLDLTQTSYSKALSDLYRIWGYETKNSMASCAQGERVLLTCYSQKMNLDKLKGLNYPSVVRLEKDNNTALYGVIYQISDNYQLLIDGYLVEVSEAWFKKYWSGNATLLWKAPFPLQGVIKFGQEGRKVSWLANQLNRQQGWPSEHKTYFDLRLVEQVSAFQREYGLVDDGIVGPRTLMLLMQLTVSNTPRLILEEN